MRYLTAAMLIVPGVIHLLPIVGVLGSEQLTTLYGLPFDDPNLSILMRHRAVLLGMLGAFFVGAAFRPRLQPLAFVTGLITVVSFLSLAWLTGGYNDRIGQVFTADFIALICLMLGGVICIYTEYRQAI